MKTKIENIIRQQVIQFYPELAGRVLEIKVLPPALKLHKSEIYEVCVSSDRGISKDIIVKRRFYNANYQNDVVEDTRREFKNLRHLEKQAQGKFRVVKGLGALAEEGLLFMEKIPGKKLSEVLKEFVKKCPSQARRAEVKAYFHRTGQCLKTFHDSGATGRAERIPVTEDIHKAKEIIDSLGWLGKRANLAAAYEHMEALKAGAAVVAIPVVLKHGDFQPRNIFIQNGEPVIFDVGGCRPAIALHDVSDFLIGLFNFNLLYPFSKLTYSIQDECAMAFLNGYFFDQPKPWPSIKFLMMLCAIQQFKGVLSRNRASILRTFWAVHYYKNLFDWLAGWGI